MQKQRMHLQKLKASKKLWLSSRPLSKVAEAVIFGRPSRDQAEKLGFVSAGVLSFSWTSAHSRSVTKMQEHSWPIQAQLSLSQDALSPARKR